MPKHLSTVDCSGCCVNHFEWRREDILVPNNHTYILRVSYRILSWVGRGWGGGGGGGNRMVAGWEQDGSRMIVVCVSVCAYWGGGGLCKPLRVEEGGNSTHIVVPNNHTSRAHKNGRLE